MEDLEVLSGLDLLGHIGVYRQAVPAAVLVLYREPPVGELLDAVCRLSPDELRGYVPVGDLLVELRRFLLVFGRHDVIVQRLADHVLGLVAERRFERRVDTLDNRFGLRQFVDDGGIVQQLDEIPQLDQL